MARLFLYPEAHGFNDYLSAWDLPKTFLEKFETLVVVANSSPMMDGTTCTFEKHPNLEDQWNHDFVNKIRSDGDLPLKKYVSFYFGADGADENYACMNTLFPTSGDPNPQHIDGILFDNEGIPKKQEGEEESPTVKVVNAFNTIATRAGVKLAWSQTLGVSKHKSPRDVANKGTTPIGTRTWDYCLEQAYTYCGDPDLSKCVTTDAKLYTPAHTCGWSTPSGMFWDTVEGLVTGAPEDRSVVMLCGYGNCQLKVDPGGVCYDERRAGDDMYALIHQRPTGYTWKNFAIWYGTDGATTPPSAGQCNHLEINNCFVSGNCGMTSWPTHDQCYPHLHGTPRTNKGTSDTHPATGLAISAATMVTIGMGVTIALMLWRTCASLPWRPTHS